MATSNSTSSTSTSSAFNVERDMIHPASSIVGNLTDFLSSISGQVDTNDSSAEVGHLRDLLDNADIAIAASRASTIDDPAQYAGPEP